MDAAEEDVLRTVVAAHSPALLGYALRLTNGDRGQAEDIVQETFVRAWRTPTALAEERGPVRPWLFTVARRISIDAHRARSSRPTEVNDAGLATLSSAPGSPETDALDARLDRVLVLDALTALSPEHRAVVVELYYQGSSVADAAARLSVPVGTVKSRAYYGLRALRLALSERGAL